MELAQAETLSQEIIDRLAPSCSQLLVVGSIRRRKPFPRDIDLLLIPQNQGALAAALQEIGTPIRGGDKLAARLYKGVQVDFYFATEATWACLLLIRTGSKEHNIRLTTLARSKGWKLKANGEGLLNENGARMAGDTEESFFRALGIPYLQPEQRG